MASVIASVINSLSCSDLYKFVLKEDIQPENTLPQP